MCFGFSRVFRQLMSRCRVCGLPLSSSDEDHFSDPPQVATNLPADDELCRLCACFRLLAIVLRQLDPRTGVVRHAFLVLEHLILLLLATGSYATEVQEFRMFDSIDWTDEREAEATSSDESQVPRL